MGEIINLNEIVEIINLIGKTKTQPFNVDIVLEDKTYRVTKEYNHDIGDDETTMYITITCDDGRLLVIRGVNHSRDQRDEYDIDKHEIDISYKITDKGIIQFSGGIKQMFDDGRCASIDEAFRVLTKDDLVSDTARKRFSAPYSILRPSYIEDTEHVRPELIDWAILEDDAKLQRKNISSNQREQIRRIRTELLSKKFSQKELRHIAVDLDFEVAQIVLDINTKLAHDLLEGLTLEELLAIQKELPDFIEKAKESKNGQFRQ